MLSPSGLTVALVDGGRFSGMMMKVPRFGSGVRRMTEAGAMPFGMNCSRTWMISGIVDLPEMDSSRMTPAPDVVGGGVKDGYVVSCG